MGYPRRRSPGIAFDYNCPIVAQALPTARIFPLALRRLPDWAARFSISAGKNALRQGIAAATARLHSGRLKVAAGACPNLLAEAKLYRTSDDAMDKRAETPVDDHKPALAALRYLVMKLDAGRNVRTGPVETAKDKARKCEEQKRQKQREWMSVRNEAWWKRLV
jgi:hypothetical protein